MLSNAAVLVFWILMAALAFVIGGYMGLAFAAIAYILTIHYFNKGRKTFANISPKGDLVQMGFLAAVGIFALLSFGMVGIIVFTICIIGFIYLWKLN